ncbi:RNA polymerase sigma-70 factor (ECF subfamily) [Pseudorhizobium tarimense]|uniref:RNA polymerase sigma-70 factor (ECF subfamily) n=1 Tax=Pseudorhizobium tarimense TaxID=1079109 RepID=A0ABV2H6U5_9HYPH|nr:RNA polymerase sigma factor [Pseudorhizobium tarimense]MCJ8519393.1 RNA polymerase sigma factor [Pseudorhizobium tarimense]
MTTTSGAPLDIRRDFVSLLPRLRRFALTLSTSVDAADELVRLACTKAIIKGQCPSSDHPVTPWLFKLVRSAALETTAKPKKLPALSNAARSPATEQQAIVLGLPTGQASAFLLVEIEGFSYAEAADILDVSSESLVARLCEARTNFAAIAAPTAERRA